jgi:hypothetical protein
MKMWNKALGSGSKLDNLVRQEVGFDGGNPESINAIYLIQGKN